jgi:orotidine-5'-phosphate decarboxylase
MLNVMLVFEDPKLSDIGETAKIGMTVMITPTSWLPPFEVTEIVPL